MELKKKWASKQSIVNQQEERPNGDDNQTEELANEGE
jgi:hypothetical protein